MKYRKTISVTRHYDIQASCTNYLKRAIGRVYLETNINSSMMVGKGKGYVIQATDKPEANPKAAPRWKRLKKDDIIQITDLAFWKQDKTTMRFVFRAEVGKKAGYYHQTRFYRLVTDNQD